MSSSTGKKIVRKVFYSTGAVVGEASKIKDGLVDIAKSFKAGYHLLSDEQIKSTGQQLDGLYGYFGRIIHENIENKELSFGFNPGYETLASQAEELLTEVSSTKENPKQEATCSHQDPQESQTVQIIQSNDPLTRLKSVVQLSRMNTPQARSALLSHAKDPDSMVRRVIVNCINPEEGEEEIFAIVKFINDPDEDVARIAIRKSAKTRNRLGFTYLISKLDSENVKIRKEAIDALILITGSDLGFNPSAAIGQRNEAVRLWQKVWQDNQMNTQFLIDDEATRAVFKKKHPEKEPSSTQEPVKHTKKTAKK